MKFVIVTRILLFEWISKSNLRPVKLLDELQTIIIKIAQEGIVNLWFSQQPSPVGENGIRFYQHQREHIFGTGIIITHQAQITNSYGLDNGRSLKDSNLFLAIQFFIFILITVYIYYHLLFMNKWVDILQANLWIKRQTNGRTGKQISWRKMRLKWYEHIVNQNTAAHLCMSICWA